MIDKKGAAIYLLITFVISFAVEAVALAVPHLSKLAYLVVLLPAGAAILASRLAPESNPHGFKLRDLPRISAARIAIMVPLIFLAVHVITTLLGVTHPAWRISETVAQLPTPTELQLPPPFAPVWPAIILGIGFVITTLLGPTLYALMMLGTEYGWRGYLLPRLMPLGKWKAYALSGALWWMSFGPFLVCRCEQPRLLFGIFSLALAIVLSALLGAISQTSRHVGLSAVFCGTFVCQATVAWRMLFPHEDTMLPLGGALGLVSIAVWACVAAFPHVFFGNLRK